MALILDKSQHSDIYKYIRIDLKGGDSRAPSKPPARPGTAGSLPPHPNPSRRALCPGQSRHGEANLRKARLQVHPRRAPSRPLSGPASRKRAKDDLCPSNHGTGGPSMGCQLSGSLALDGADLGVLYEAILRQERTIETGTPMMRRFSLLRAEPLVTPWPSSRPRVSRGPPS